MWTLAWHPLGHILCSGSNDHTIKFWTRNRPGDQMRDKYNLNTLPASLAGLDECELEDHVVIPGMGPEDKIDIADSLGTNNNGVIPGLDFANVTNFNEKMREKKIPYSKPIPRNFQAQWNEASKFEEHRETSDEIKDVISQLVDSTPGSAPLKKNAPSAIILYDRVIQVQRKYSVTRSPIIAMITLFPINFPAGSDLEAAVLEGPTALNRFILMGRIPDLQDILPPIDDEDLMDENGAEILATRIKMEIDPTFIYNKTTVIEPSEPPDATEPLLSSTSLMKRRTPPPPTPDPTAGIPSLLQLEIAPPMDIMFSTDEVEDEMALRNSKKGREREKLKEKERREQEEEKKFWAEHNEVNWDEEDMGGGGGGGGGDNNFVSSRPLASPGESHNTNSNGQWSTVKYESSAREESGLGGNSWEMEVDGPPGNSKDNSKDGSGFSHQQKNFGFNQGPPSFGGPSNFASNSFNAGPNNFGPNNFNSRPNNYSSGPTSFSQGPPGPNSFGPGANSFNAGVPNSFNPNVPPGLPPNFNQGPPPNFNSGPPGNFNFNGPPPGGFNNNFASGPPPNNFSNYNNGGNNFGPDNNGGNDGGDGGWNNSRGGNRSRGNNMARGGRGNQQRGFRGGNRRN